MVLTVLAAGHGILYLAAATMLLIFSGDRDEESWDKLIREAFSRGFRLYSDDPDIEEGDVTVWVMDPVPVPDD